MALIHFPRETVRNAPKMKESLPIFKHDYGPGWAPRARAYSSTSRLRIAFIMVLFTASISLFYLLSSTSASASASAPKNQSQSCNSIEHGYQCFPSISHLWGQYSPYFSLEQESAIPQAVPDSCIVTFAQVLSRHGARYPTESKSAKYADLISSIQSNISSSSFSGKYAFLKEYEYTLGADDLTAFGEDQMVDSGAKFYQRYKELAREITPFIRASGSGRVVASAEKFIEGFTKAKEDDHLSSRGDTATVNVILPETDGFNNTLDHSTCTAFESNEDADTIEDNFTSLIAPPIAKRLESDLPGITLTNNQVIYLMDMCSFDTVARSRTGTTLSPFCTLFTETEWIQYDYLQSLSKYYGYGAGATLGPAQGIGFTNELIARLTQSPVHDTTSTNRTFDADPATFPLDRRLYADFSHDNSMISIFFAMGLYNGTAPLSQSKVETIAEMDGYAASWTVPFGARAYFEVLDCEGEGETEPLVRVLVNDRVVPLHGCVVDEAGRCSFDEWVRGLSFARSGGNWWSCYAA